MAKASDDSFSSTSGLLAGAGSDEAPVQQPALSRLNPGRPRGFRALVRAAAGASDAVPETPTFQQSESPRIGALARDDVAMSGSSNSPLLRRQGEASSSQAFAEDSPPAAEQRSPSLADLVPDGRKGSFIGVRRAARQEPLGVDGEPPPTNEAVAQAVQEKVAAAVETQRKYKHVLWYSLFVAAYLIVLYLQASAYNSGEVVSTLRNALMPSGGMTTTFASSDDVLAYIGNQILTPTWVDPVCGDGNCEYPWEFPSWGRFGCKADCGEATQTTTILVQVKSNFVGSTTVTAATLMAAASWNVCLDDPTRRSIGEADLCWFAEDQTFSALQATDLETMTVVDGTWYVSLKGDYAGRVSGAVYDYRNSSNPVQLATTPTWTTCSLSSSSSSTSTSSRRSLLEEWTEEHLSTRRKLLTEDGSPGSTPPSRADAAEAVAALQDLAKKLQILGQEVAAQQNAQRIAEQAGQESAPEKSAVPVQDLARIRRRQRNRQKTK